MKSLNEVKKDLIFLKENHEAELYAWNHCNYSDAVITLTESGIKISVGAIDENGCYCFGSIIVTSRASIDSIFSDEINALKMIIDDINKELTVIESFDMFLQDTEDKTGFRESKICDLIDYMVINPEEN